MTDGLEGVPEDLPAELTKVFRRAAEESDELAPSMARLVAATEQFAVEARRAGLPPETMLVILKECLEQSKLRRRRTDLVRVRERLITAAIDTYFES